MTLGDHLPVAGLFNSNSSTIYTAFYKTSNDTVRRAVPLRQLGFLLIILYHLRVPQNTTSKQKINFGESYRPSPDSTRTGEKNPLPTSKSVFLDYAYTHAPIIRPGDTPVRIA